MPAITSIEPQKRNAERVNIYLDGTFAFGAALSLVIARGLHAGLALSAEDLSELQRDDEVERAFGSALNLLSYRPRSRREIEDYFRRRQLDPVVAGAVVDRLERAALLDDREFARFWVENRQQFRPRGTRALRVEMRQKGLDSEIIAEALAQVDDEDESALAAGAKKARSFSALDEREFMRKMVAFLQRRGFPYDVAARSARTLRASVADPISDEDN